MSITQTQAKQALLERDAAWSAAASARAPVEEVLDFWTDDAVVVPPGMPPVSGRQALRDYVSGSYVIPGFRISWEADRVDVSEDGSMAWIIGTNEVELTGEDGTPVTVPGRVVTVWRNESGTWRCCADIWNSA